MLLALALSLSTTASAQTPDSLAERARWARESQAVTIVRDDWGIAHVRGHTDADAVFGMIYAQAEDDFDRIEYNYLDALGRRAEADGERAIWSDLRERLYVDPDSLRAQYARTPEWLKRLMDAWADGLNFYLATHPAVQPRVLTRFEPWMALSFTEGSIGGDVEKASLAGIEAFYGDSSAAATESGAPEDGNGDAHDRQGSNGIAIAPRLTRNHHALLLINPHTTFYFRSVLQMTSDEGLNVYGAVTWGQFFVYQGFNERLGFMHTTSGLDAVDEFRETIVRGPDGLRYRYGKEERPVTVSTVDITYRKPDGALTTRRFVVYRTHHGPIVRAENGHWISMALMQRPIEALCESFGRNTARDWAAYQKVMGLRANSSNTEVYADADGHIALLLPQFVPQRDDRFDYSRPVDGSDPATDWRGLTPLNRVPQVVDPPNGWIQNHNNWPWSAAGSYSPKKRDYPRYMDDAGEQPRAIHSMRLLRRARQYTLDSLQHLAFDPWLPGFALLVPRLVAAYDALPRSDSMRRTLAAPIAALRRWDHRWSTTSVATSLAVYWGIELRRRTRASIVGTDGLTLDQRMDRASSPRVKLETFAASLAKLEHDFGSWRTPWGEINRFQRLTDIPLTFSDSAPSLPVGFTSSAWGSLAAFASKPQDGTRRWYGYDGNTFVAVVEFGDSVRARAVTPGGVSGHPHSPHFNDEARAYVTGNLREVYFYPSQLAGHTERTYHPGE